MQRIIFTFLGLLISSFVSFASVEVRSEHITIANGLADNTVRYFLQDSKGFIWFGTLNGLSRYDGSSFVSYYPSSEHPLSLADQKVYEMQEDNNNFLWLSFSSEQISCYDLKTASFIDYTGCGEYHQKYSSKLIASNGDVWLWHNGNGARRILYHNGIFRSVVYKEQNNNIPGNNVTFISEDSSGNIWIGTNKGLLQVHGEEETIIDGKESFHHSVCYEGNTYFLTNSNKLLVYDTSSSALVQLAELPSAKSFSTGYFLLGDQWHILTSEGIFNYDLVNRKFAPSPVLLPDNIRSASVLTDNKGNIWMYNHTGKIWYINVQAKDAKPFQLLPPDKMGHIDAERYRIVHDSRNMIWISTYGNGLFTYDIAKDELSHFTASMDGFSHITSDYLLNVMEDHSGSIWVSSEFTGVTKLSVINENVRRYFPENPELLDRSNTVRMVSRLNDDEIWVGTREGGLYVYNSDFKLKSPKRQFNSNIYAAEKDENGNMWLGTRGDGILIGNTWYKNNSADKSSISNNNIFCIYKDTKHRMWVGTFGGGLNLAKRTDKGYIFSSYLNKSYGQRQIRAICEDKNGMLWVGTSDGIYIFNPDSLIAGDAQHYHYSYMNGGLKSNVVKYLYPDSQGNIWIGTSGAGFSICDDMQDYSSLTFEHYSIKDGLCNDIVQSITEDKQGNIWLATEYGVSKFVRSQRIFENYFFSEQQLGNVYTEGTVCRFSNGNILFGSNYGLVIINPVEVKKTVVAFPIVFTNLNVNGINMLPGDPDSSLKNALAYSDEVKLKYNQNSIVVDFSSFNFSDAGDIKYSYKLNNYDKDWSSPTKLSFAAYKMLPPGKYELLVKSSNSSGVWNEEASMLQIIITPPFYMTVWAFVIYIILISIVLFFVFRITRNFNRLNNKIEIEKQLTDYKLVFFTNISHEFRTPLTLIQGALERIWRMNVPVKELGYPLQTMEKSTKRMLRLIDQLLEFRKMQNNKLALSLEETDVIAMLYEIFLSFEDMAESKNMDFQFIPATTSYKMFIDKGKLDKVVYNLLSNAFKYTPQGGKVFLYINIDYDREVLEIRVQDTGVGIPKEKQGELFKRFMQSNFSGESMGIGLHLTFELVQVHKGNISYDDNKEGGSVFIVNLPLSANVYEEKDFLIANNILMQGKHTVTDNDMGLLLEDAKEMPIKPDPLNKQKILVIEDDVDVRQYLKEELSAYFQVEVADNGIAGFEAAQDINPDLIVCDVLMPGMNGYEVTRKLKSEFNTSHIPVILLTALSLPENHLEGIESGADAYLSKPFSIRLLLMRIIKLLEQRERLKEKFSEEPGIVRSAIYASDRDKEFVDQLHQILTDNLDNSNFSVDEFASLMKLGRTVFYKKVKGVTGYSPNEYLRIMRMKRAAELLLTTNLTVSEVSYKVGIDDPFYFSKCFKTQFGVAPSVYKASPQASPQPSPKEREKESNKR